MSQSVHERQTEAHLPRLIRDEHALADMKKLVGRARHLGGRERMDATVQAAASLLSHQQTAERILAR
ncbi:hypothetical protein [Streptomyces anulatus]|uniref:hypothetical protein n=1 Tax=Streptomyces anulatus TaxID=1892 RepID=UPI00068C14B1|nr:hypothetical protein [Streptomyces anulatus]